MNREIKFRARNANVPRCWIYGYFIIENDKCFIINNDGKFEVIAGTECQFIGLKDKNGKEIYEGDVIKYIHKEGFEGEENYWKEHTQTIIFTDGCFHPRPKEWNNYDDYPCSISEFEVIGNIHENPELLGDE